MKGKQTVFIANESKAYVLNIKKLLQKYNNDLQLVGSANKVNSALTKILEHKPDIIFIEIEFTSGNGFIIADSVQMYLPKTAIVFTSNKPEFAVKAIKYRPYGFLIRPDFDKDLKPVVKRILTEKESPLEKKLILTSGSNDFIINIDNILYCEISNNKRESLIFYEIDKYYSAKEQLTSLEKKLLYKNFFKVNRTHLVNLNYLKEVLKNEKMIVLEKNAKRVEIPASKRKIKNLYQFHIY